MKVTLKICILFFVIIGCGNSKAEETTELGTCQKALKLIAAKDYASIQKLFAQSINNQQIDLGADFIAKYGLPEKQFVKIDSGEIPYSVEDKSKPMGFTFKKKKVRSYSFPFPSGQEKRFIAFMFYENSTPDTIGSMMVMDQEFIENEVKNLAQTLQSQNPPQTQEPFLSSLKFNPDNIASLSIYFSGYDKINSITGKRDKMLYVSGKTSKFTKYKLNAEIKELFASLSQATIEKKIYNAVFGPFELNDQFINLSFSLENDATKQLTITVALRENDKTDPLFKGYIVVQEFTVGEHDNIKKYLLPKEKNPKLLSIMKKLALSHFAQLKEINQR